MKISAVNYNKKSNIQSFGVDMGNIVSSLVSKARFDSFLTKNPKRIAVTLRRIDELKKMKNNYVLTAFLDEIKTNGLRRDCYVFQLTPRGYCKGSGKTIQKLSNDTPAMVVLAKLFKAVKNFQE